MILAFDTATPATVVGVGRDDGTLLAERRHDPAPGDRPGHATELLALSAAALSECGASFADVTRIAVGVGPGTFTGLRIGIATARALAQASGAELVGVSTLQTLLRDGVDLAVLDARRGEAFVLRVGEETARVVAPQALADEQATLAAGDGSRRFRASLEAAGITVPQDDSSRHLVTAAALCELGATAAPVAHDRLVPDYVRAPDATPRK